MALSIVILAAGQGTRMKSRLPKVLQPLAKRSLLQHVVDTANQLQPQNTIVVYGHGGQAVQDAFNGQGLGWAEQAQQLGTGHAVQQALPQIGADDQILILYGDVPLVAASTMQSLVSATEDGSLAVLTVEADDPAGYGRIIRNPQQSVVGIVEHKDCDEQQLDITEVNTGLIACPGELLHRYLNDLSNDNSQGEYYLTDVIAMAADDQVTVKGVLAGSETEVMGINNRTQLAQAERAYQLQQAEVLMANGVHLVDPARIDVRGTLSCGRDVELDINVIIEGDVHLADGVKIGPNCLLRNVSIGEDTTIAENSVLEECTAAERCTIGPFARLRPGTELQAGAKVGNFVEIKKAKVGPGSKVNHLTYVGDAEIGSNVNVGAGTVTCNYDGANKSQTIIGDNAFIGSGSMLVAPVNIGAGATIGAGSTINKEAPDGALTVARAKQKTISSWQRPVKKA